MDLVLVGSSLCVPSLSPIVVLAVVEELTFPPQTDLFLVAIPIVYGQIYNFNTGEAGMIYITQFIGSCIGLGALPSFPPFSFISGLILLTFPVLPSFSLFSLRPVLHALLQRQRRQARSRGAFFRSAFLLSRRSSQFFLQARLYSAFGAGICVPVGAFIFCFTAYPQCHWIGSAIGVVILCALSFPPLVFLSLTGFFDSPPLVVPSSLHLLSTSADVGMVRHLLPPSSLFSN
jgi:hypothetical protein